MAVATVKAAVGAVTATLLGDNTANTLSGVAKANIMFGEGGKDVLTGNDGDDRMHGGGGSDLMSGAGGNDTMFGSSTASGVLDMSKFKATEATTAKVTFNYESAGYQNALGVYKIAADGTISGVQILFANASLKGSGGDLVAGVSSVNVPVEAGERLGFFVVPDGFSQRGMANLLSDTRGSFKFVDANGNAGNVNGGAELKLVHTGASGQETVVKSAYGSTVFHSVDTGGMGLNGDKLNHTKATVDATTGKVKIGFEDLKGGGDKDFDDSVFTVDMGTTNAALLAKVATKPAASSDKDDMSGGDGNDRMFGMGDDDKMSGGAGDDQMWGNAGNDKMDGGAGNDSLSGGKGNDVIADGEGNDIVTGNTGTDTFIAGEGDDSYDGGSEFDTIDYSNAKGGVKVDLNSHTASGMGNDTIKSVEAVIGSAFADVLVGDKADNVFNGGAGDDAFRGRGGADTFTGGAGNDSYTWLAKDLGTGVDRITDFGKGDALDLHDLLKGAKFSDIDEVVKLSDTRSGTVVSVNVGGAFVDVVSLDNVHGASADDLLSAGMILV